MKCYKCESVIPDDSPNCPYCLEIFISNNYLTKVYKDDNNNL